MDKETAYLIFRSILRAVENADCSKIDAQSLADATVRAYQLLQKEVDKACRDKEREHEQGA